MMRKLKILTTLALMVSAPMAFAIPSNLFQITNIGGTEGYVDQGYQAAMLTDTDGSNDDATAFLFFEMAGFAYANTFGIYDYSIDGAGNIVRGNTLEVFDGAAVGLYDDIEESESVTLHFDLANGMVTNQNTSVTVGIDETFGFYLTTPENDGYTYYSHTALNPDGVDHLMMFDTSDNLAGGLFGSDLVLAWEDLYGGGDLSYDDMVVGISDVSPVPEPSVIALMGLGFVGLGFSRNNRRVALYS